MKFSVLRTWGISGLIVVLLVAAAAEGQQPRRPRGRGPFRRPGRRDGLAFLVAVPEIQEELGVTPEQQQLLDALQEDLRAQRRGLFRRGFDRPRGGRDGRQRSADNRGRVQSLNKQIEKLVAIVLECDQMERLHQLRLRQEGLRALDRPEFVEILGLSEAQLEEIRELRDAERSARNDPERERLSYEKRARREEKLEMKVGAVLTKEQKQRWKILKGNEFNFPDRLARFGGRRFQNRRGNTR